MQNVWRIATILSLSLTSLTGCGFFVAKALDGREAGVPENFNFVGDMAPCYLELTPGSRALRVNCFHLDGVLHIHSARYSKLPRISGESWIVTIESNPHVRVQIGDQIYALYATKIDDENRRQQILYARGYTVAWDGIEIFSFTHP
ncbi:MAG: hypothetical protein AAF541_23355 [Pseudomonadota bacterium]